MWAKVSVPYNVLTRPTPARKYATPYRLRTGGVDGWRAIGNTFLIIDGHWEPVTNKPYNLLERQWKHLLIKRMFSKLFVVLFVGFGWAPCHMPLSGHLEPYNVLECPATARTRTPPL